MAMPTNNTVFNSVFATLESAYISTPENHTAIIQNTRYVEDIAGALSYLQEARILNQRNFDAIIQNVQYVKDIKYAILLLLEVRILNQDNFDTIIQNAQYATDIADMIYYHCDMRDFILDQSSFDTIIRIVKKANFSLTPYALRIAVIIILAGLATGVFAAISILSVGTVPAFLAGLVGLTGLGLVGQAVVVGALVTGIVGIGLGILSVMAGIVCSILSKTQTTLFLLYRSSVNPNPRINSELLEPRSDATQNKRETIDAAPLTPSSSTSPKGTAVSKGTEDLAKKFN